MLCRRPTLLCSQSCALPAYALCRSCAPAELLPVTPRSSSPPLLGPPLGCAPAEPSSQSGWPPRSFHGATPGWWTQSRWTPSSLVLDDEQVAPGAPWTATLAVLRTFPPNRAQSPLRLQHSPCCEHPHPTALKSPCVEPPGAASIWRDVPDEALRSGIARTVAWLRVGACGRARQARVEAAHAAVIGDTCAPRSYDEPYQVMDEAPAPALRRAVAAVLHPTRTANADAAALFVLEGGCASSTPQSTRCARPCKRRSGHLAAGMVTAAA